MGVLWQPQVWKKQVNSNNCLWGYWNTPLNRLMFLDFKLWWLPFSKPVDLGKRYIPQKKRLYSSKWMYIRNCKDFHHEILWDQNSASRSLWRTLYHLNPYLPQRQHRQQQEDSRIIDLPVRSRSVHDFVGFSDRASRKIQVSQQGV